MTLNILLSFAQFEREIKGERIRDKEAARVREIFRLYLEKESFLAVVTTLREKGWANKRRVTKTGKQLCGRPFDKATLHHLLVNPVEAGA